MSNLSNMLDNLALPQALWLYLGGLLVKGEEVGG